MNMLEEADTSVRTYSSCAGSSSVGGSDLVRWACIVSTFGFGIALLCVWCELVIALRDQDASRTRRKQKKGKIAYLLVVGRHGSPLVRYDLSEISNGDIWVFFLESGADFVLEEDEGRRGTFRRVGVFWFPFAFAFAGLYGFVVGGRFGFFRFLGRDVRVIRDAVDEKFGAGRVFNSIGIDFCEFGAGFHGLCDGKEALFILEDIRREYRG